MSLRDANVVIIEVGRTVIRAGLGLHELLKTPTVEFQARVGLLRDEQSASTSSLSPKDYLVGVQLDEALAAGQDVQVSWPFINGDISDWTQAEALWKHILFAQLHRRRVQNESPVMLSIFATLSRETYERTCQIFFERFNVAAFGIIHLPTAQLYAANALTGLVVDIGQRTTDITPLADGAVLPSLHTTAPLGLLHCQHYLAHLLKSNTAVTAALSPPHAPLAPAELHATLLELVRKMWQDDTIKVPSDGESAPQDDEGLTDIAAVLVAGKEKAVIESGLKKKASAKASAAEQARAREIEALDLITVQFQDMALTVGRERHRFCEPLFDPGVLAGIPFLDPELREGLDGMRVRPLQEVVGHVVGQTDVDQRMYIWQGLLVTGEITRHVQGVGVALQSRLAPYIGGPDLQSDVQPRAINLVSVPKYYAEYVDTGNGYAGFLGTSITAKVVFGTNDFSNKSFVSKADYTAKGPHAIIEMSPCLL